MFFSKKVTGDYGEDLAVAELKKRGYEIIGRNWRGRGGELDIIAKEKNELVFIEVKTRRNLQFGHPEVAVNARKTRHLTRTVREYCQQHNLVGKIITRGDIVAITLTENSPPEIVIFKDAITL